jgi:PPOX class probable F420-dependent enzyme
MNEVFASDARRDAQRDLLAHPERPWPHEALVGRIVAEYAYEDAHPRGARTQTTRPARVVEPFVALTGKYLSLTTFRRDGTGVATPVWFVQEGRRLLVQTDRDSYKVRRIRGNPDVKIAVCAATGRLRGKEMDGRAELLPDTEIGRVERLFADKYRRDLVFIRPLRALQAMLRRDKRRTDSVIVAITPR